MAFELFEAHEKMSESEARQRTLLHTIPDLVWLKDVDGIYLACNSTFEQFFRAKEADIVGKTDYDFVDKEQADFFRSMTAKPWRPASRASTRNGSPSLATATGPCWRPSRRR